MLMPTRDERPPRLRTPGSALTTGGSGMIDQDLPSFCETPPGLSTVCSGPIPIMFVASSGFQLRQAQEWTFLRRFTDL
jgi:hypothetical protein